MTMLDRMRRHKSWLKWSLAIVCATFVLLYVPQFLDPTGTGAGAAASDTIATVNGREIPATVYQRLYTQQIGQMRASYGQLTDDMIRQLGFGQRLMQQLVSQEAQLAEAERLGLTVTDGELRERLVRLPSFQENGVFIGEDRYLMMLGTARPPVQADEFEEDFRKSLLAEKLQTAVTGWIRVTDADVAEEYRRRNEKVRLDLAVFNAADFRKGLEPTDAELNAEFTANTETYRIPEKRRVRYISLDTTALRATMTATPQEVEARYRENVAMYTTPEQVRASHILFKTEGKDEAAVRTVAEGVLAKVKGGADFAALARQYSEDGSKDLGGDLDFFSKGTMVPEFDQAVWGLQPSQTTDLVKTQFGFHIIKLTDRRAAGTRPLDQVRPQLEEQIRSEKAQADAERLATELDKEITSPADLDRVAQARGLRVGDSGLFRRDEPLAGLGSAPTVAAEAFTMEQGEVSDALPTGQGFVFIALAEINPSYLPKLDEVRALVTDKVVQAKAVRLAQEKAASIATAASGNFAAAARAAGGTLRPTELIARGAAYPEIGVSDRIDNAAFSLKVGETSQPVATDTAVVVVHVRERQEGSSEALAAERETLRDQLTNERRSAFFSAYMAKAMETMDITYNQATIAALIGS